MKSRGQQQRKNIKKNVAILNFLETGKRNVGAFKTDQKTREMNDRLRGVESLRNVEERGNPLSLVANEETPNPARRSKLMKLARFNKDSGR